MKHKIFFILLFGIMIHIVSSAGAQQRPQDPRKRPPDVLQDIQKLTPEQEQSVLEHVEATYPEEKYQKLLELKNTRNILYNRLLMKAYRELEYMEQLKQRDPDQYEMMQEKKELEIQTKELVDQYKNSTSESEKEKLKDQITGLLNRIFDIRQVNRQKEIERLEKRLQEAKINNKKRLENKELIVNERLEDLLGEEKWMRW